MAPCRMPETSLLISCRRVRAWEHATQRNRTSFVALLASVYSTEDGSMLRSALTLCGCNTNCRALRTCGTAVTATTAPASRNSIKRARTLSSHIVAGSSAASATWQCVDVHALQRRINPVRVCVCVDSRVDFFIEQELGRAGAVGNNSTVLPDIDDAYIVHVLLTRGIHTPSPSSFSCFAIYIG